MKNTNVLPDYSQLFGNVDFKEGDKSRTVFSPAAYLADLLQLLEDEFEINTCDFNQRRTDIRDILLDDENTYELIPFLDVVVEVLENKAKIDDVKYLIKILMGNDAPELIESCDNKLGLIYQDILSETVNPALIRNVLNKINQKAIERDSKVKTFSDINNLDDNILKSTFSLDDTKDFKSISAYSSSKEMIYQVLKFAVYPFNMPFDLNNEEVKLYLKYLNISSEQLYKLFNSDINDGDTIATEYLGLSKSEDHFITEENNSNVEIEAMYNYTGINFLSDLSKVDLFLTSTGLSGKELRDLLYQNLYYSATAFEDGRSDFFINKSLNKEGCYAKFDVDEQNITWEGISTLTDPEKYKWFSGVGRFIRLSKKTDTNFRDLDLILRNLCSCRLAKGNKAIQTIAIVKKLSETLNLDINVVVSILSSIVEEGLGVNKMPEDLFNGIFNNLFAVVDNKYILCSKPVAPQFIDENYSEITYFDDLYCASNDLFRNRIQRALGISKTDLQQITFQLSYKDIDDSLWMKKENKSKLLNFLYTFTIMAKTFDLSHKELFTLFDIIEKDISIRNIGRQYLFIDILPDRQNCYEILFDQTENKDKIIVNRLWLIQTLSAINKWLKEYQFDCGLLWQIVNGKLRTEKEKAEFEKFKISSLNNLYQAFLAKAFSENSMIVDPFDSRNAKIIFDAFKSVYSDLKDRNTSLVYDNEAEFEKIARLAIDKFDQLSKFDFKGLNIEEKLVDKIFSNLVNLGYIDTDGNILENKIPQSKQDFLLEIDFSSDQKLLFDIIHNLYLDEEENETDTVELSVYPSDLSPLGYTGNELQEVYDNLIFNNYINEEGVVQYVNFFSVPENYVDFDINTHLQEHAPAIYELIQKQITKFNQCRILLKSSVFDELSLTDGDKKALIENLKFNGYIDSDLLITDKYRVLKEDYNQFNLALKYYPNRKKILDIIKNQVEEERTNCLILNKAMLTEAADDIVSDWVFEDLQNDYINGSRIFPEAKKFFLDANNKKDFILGYYFDGFAGEAVFERMAEIINFSDKFKFTAGGICDLGFNSEEQAEVLELLVEKEYLNGEFKIANGRYEFFLNPDNAVVFNLEGFEDYNKEIFFQIFSVATEISNAQNTIINTLKSIAEEQEQVVLEQLQSIFGTDSVIVKSISEKVFDNRFDFKSSWLLPLLKIADTTGEITSEPQNNEFNVAFRRIMQLVNLAKQLELSKEEVEIAIRDQNLIAKFPEKVVLPDGIDSFDALLETNDFIYIFIDEKYLIYRASDYALLDMSYVTGNDSEIYKLQDDDEALRIALQSDPIRDLYRNLLKNEIEDCRRNSKVFKISAAFRDKKGNLYIVVDDHYYVKNIDNSAWDKRNNEFGNIYNPFEGVTAVDASYIDSEGRLFLFADNQYVRYSSDINIADAVYVDKGYPKSIDESWNKENQDIQFPPEFQSKPDAAFEGVDNKTYFFKGNTFICSENPGQILNVSDFWGKIENVFVGANGIDAAYSTDDAYYLFAGEQVIKYEDSLENSEVHIADGFPKKISEFFSQIPYDFCKGLDTAFQGTDGSIHLFKGDKTIDLNSTSSPKTEDINKNWGIIQNNIKENGRIDAAFIGLDGYTYLFSGNQYWRYSTNDYSVADEGYPRRISDDWACLVFVDSAFVMDGKTYVFGRDAAQNDIYVRYSTSNYTKVDAPDEKTEFVAVKPNRPDIEDFEVFPRSQDDAEWWSFPVDFLKKDDGGRVVGKIDAVLSTYDNKVIIFSGNKIIEYDHAHRWWSEPVLLQDKWEGLPEELSVTYARVDAALYGKDGYTYIFYGSKFIRLSINEPCKVDNGYPKTISKYWGKIKNNIEKNCRIDAALAVKSYLPTVMSFYRKEDSITIPHYFVPSTPTETKNTILPTLDSGFTFEFLFKPLKYAGSASEPITLLQKGEDLKVILTYSKKTIVVLSGVETIVCDTPLSLNKWHYFYLSYNGIHISLVIKNFEGLNFPSENKPQGRFQCKINPNDFPLIFGKPGEHDGFIGYMDVIRIWNKYKDADEFAENMPVKLSGNEDGLVGYYVLDNNQVRDITGISANIVASGISAAAENESLYNGASTGIIHTYLFSGDQYYRYFMDDYSCVEPGYPRNISFLRQEPRFKNLKIEFTGGIDAAYGDRRNVYLFVKNSCQVVTDKAYIRLDDVRVNAPDGKHNLSSYESVLIENGKIYGSYGDKWYSITNLDAESVSAVSAIPAFIEEKNISDNYKSSLNAVLKGVDGNTYLFKADKYYDSFLNREFSIDEQWGRARNNIIADGTIDAAFVGRDCKTYIFSGDQFVQYTQGNVCVDQPTEKAPRSISKYWGGLNNVALAYVQGEYTYLFERPNGDGQFRYLRYSGKDYTTPDTGYPMYTDINFWNIPENMLNEGFGEFNAVFCDESGENLIFIKDRKFASFNIKTANWSYTKPLEVFFKGIPLNDSNFRSVKTILSCENTLYFFSEDSFVTYGPLNKGNGTSVFGNICSIKDHWGINRPIRNIDAAFVYDSNTTFLFSGNEYVRYSSSDYRTVDDEYPKETAKDLCSEEAFMYMGEYFKCDLINGLRIKAVFGNGRNLYVVTGSDDNSINNLHVSVENTFDEIKLESLGRVRNNFQDTGKVDAAFLKDNNTYLFSGDQYIRYSSDNYKYIETEYPKLISDFLKYELKDTVNTLPSNFVCDLDAAFLTKNGRVNETGILYLFKGKKFWESENHCEKDIHDKWGKIKNEFNNDDKDKTIDGAVVDNDGRLYVFKNTFFIRYSSTDDLFSNNNDRPKYIDPQYPLKTAENWPYLSNMLSGVSIIDGAFTFDNRLYFINSPAGGTPRYIMYNSINDKTAYKSIYPQEFKYRWKDFSDLLLSDVMLISRFKALQEKSTGCEITLTQFLNKSCDDVAEPYALFAQMFGFDKDEVRWLKTRNAFLSSSGSINQLELDFDIELVVRMYDILSTTRLISVEVQKLYNNGWVNLYSNPENPDKASAAKGIYELLGSIDYNNNYVTLFDQIKDELNTIKRNALVPYIISRDSSIRNVRDLYAKLLIDIEMESSAETSRIVEAVGAVQLYMHRYFLNLEDLDIKGQDDIKNRAELKDRWKWMKNYRLWEANRKVFLYPENYIRPELRDADIKTPQFKTLEEDLTKGEITADSVENAYRKYLDEYTEVSRLTIAGGYVFDPPVPVIGTKEIDKELILFGRTKIDPVRFYYRFANFLKGDDSVTWFPWISLNINIHAEGNKVYPIYAFNRVFVFWATVEKTIEASNSTTLVETHNATDNTTYASDNSNNGNLKYSINIYYSFYNLNQQWSQPQLFNSTITNSPNDGLSSTEQINSITLKVEHSEMFGDHDYNNIIITCAYNKETLVYRLTPELYSKQIDCSGVFKHKTGADIFSSLFPKEEAIEEFNAVTICSKESSPDGRWYVFNRKGGSLLCKPYLTKLTDGWPKYLPDNIYNITKEDGIDSAVYCRNDKTYFFKNNGKYFIGNQKNVLKNIVDSWGRSFYDLRVKAAMVYDQNLYLFSNGKNAIRSYYYDKDFTLQSSNIKRIAAQVTDLDTPEKLNKSGFPSSWINVDAAFIIPDTNRVCCFNGTEYSDDGTLGGNANPASKAITSRWGRLSAGTAGNVDVDVKACFKWDGISYLIDNKNTLYKIDKISLDAVNLTKLCDNANLGNIISELIHGFDFNAPQNKQVKTYQGNSISHAFQSNGIEGVDLNVGGSDVITIKIVTGVKTVYCNDNKNYATLNPQEREWNCGFTDRLNDHIAVAILFRNNNTAQIWNGPDATATVNITQGSVTSATPTTTNEVTAALPSITIGSADYAIIFSRNRFITIQRSFLTNQSLDGPDGPNSKSSNIPYAKKLIETIQHWEISIAPEDTSMNIFNNGIGAAFVDNDKKLFLVNSNFARFVCYSYRQDENEHYGEFIDGNMVYEFSKVPDSAIPSWMKAGVILNGREVFFDNSSQSVEQKYGIYDLNTKSFPIAESLVKEGWGRIENNIVQSGRIDAAYSYSKDNKNYLCMISGNQFFRYTYNNSSIIESTEIDAGYPKTLGNNLDSVDLAFTLNNILYLFKDKGYYKVINCEPDYLDEPYSITGNWGNTPDEFLTGGRKAAVNINETMFILYIGEKYIKYGSPDGAELLYEISDAKFEIIRLTTNTADKLNQCLFVYGIDSLLSLETQEINEIPSFSTIANSTSPSNIMVDENNLVIGKPLPDNTHLDFNSANGIYYWEIFFHIPFLIAQSLNTCQRFEDAKKWYEYIFNPTQKRGYWGFLPFLSVDIDDIVTSTANELKKLIDVLPEGTVDNFPELLKDFDAEFQGERSFSTTTPIPTHHTVEDLERVCTDTEIQTKVTDYLNNISKDTPADLVNAATQFLELYEMIKELPKNYNRMQTTNAQIGAYFDDPFDPHSIAILRPIAYRKAIVMQYIDNLLDWGDMLFRQYSHESIDEARMLYILAYDLLGEKPSDSGKKVLSEPKPYKNLVHYTGADPENSYDYIFDLENTINIPYESLSFSGLVHDTITNPYFYIPENELFIDYWNRVEDRLYKIRNSLDIDGISRPLALFQPPINPMALVQAVASGVSLSEALSGFNVPVPHYRFSFMLAKTRELIYKLNQFGGDLLIALEKKDAEEMSMLQNRQESVILNMTTQIKNQQIEDCKATIEMLTINKNGVEKQMQHYQNLLDNGLLQEESAQIGMLLAAAGLNGITALADITSGLSYVIPQFTVGVFSFGTTSGGKNVGDMLKQFAVASDKIAQGLQMGGDASGIYAQHKRSVQDWEMQRNMAESEKNQLEKQIMGANMQKAIAEAELMIHLKEIENNESIKKFMIEKYSNSQLYSWISDKLSGIYYQTYKMAHDMAKQTEKAFQFETGMPESQVNFINGIYWDSRRKGLLSGESLGFDLDRMEKAYIEQNNRSFEITKSISMLELDPLAFLKLKTDGVCEFRLTEELFDYDYPGHYNRKIATISLAFDAGEGKTVNATLTQLNNKVVMEPDIKAVKYLMNPRDEQPASIRVDWRPNQQVALSYVDQYTENNGMFELRFDNDRFLPFEGTGAVSLWRLELNGKRGSYNLNELLDVTVKLRYTADQGGSAFANAVKGVLRPYNATSFFDLAYNFTDQWNDYMLSDSKDLILTLNVDMFPNMASSKISGMFLKYEYNGDTAAAFVLNDDLELKNNSYVDISNVNISKNGTDIKLTVKGEKANIKNVEMVVVYKAKV